MNKKIVFKLSLGLNVVLIIALIVLSVFFRKVVLNNGTNLTNQAQAPVAKIIYHQPKPLKLVWMTAQEKASFNLSTSTTNKIQVLSRDKKGKITAYRVIRKSSDIVTKY